RTRRKCAKPAPRNAGTAANIGMRVKASSPTGESKGGNDIDFDQGVLRKTRNLDGRASGRRLGEEFAVDLVHGGEIVHVFEIDGGLHNVVKVGTCSLNNPLDVVHDALGLLGNG